ncbi:MAG: hypothetical protein GC150_04835 [Rhizobiales bacterium]|nr:hypothetical protein [Hyphomicrobiales bacterium]
MSGTGERPVLIAGAGIAGLATALALARRGMVSSLLERSAKLSEAGAGIQLGPNATRILGQLGLGERLAAVSAEPRAIVVRDGHGAGALLSRIPIGSEMRRRFGAPYLVLHRAALQGLLVDAVGAEPMIRLELGKRVTGWRLRETGAVGRNEVEAEVEEGDAADGGRPGWIAKRAGCGLVVADGIWSRLRKEVLGGDARPPRLAGKSASRALIAPADLPSSIAADEVGLWLLAHAHVVHYPVTPGGAVNVVVVLDEGIVERGDGTAHHLPWERDVAEEALAGALSGAARPLRELVEAGRGWRCWPLAVMHAPHVWARDGAVLVGDAAHPVLPFLAQGGGLAIEDASVLAEELAHEAEGGGGLDAERFMAAARRYQARRVSRARRLQGASIRNGRIYHLSGVARLVRNAAMRALPARALLAPYGWIYGYVR